MSIIVHRQGVQGVILFQAESSGWLCMCNLLGTIPRGVTGTSCCHNTGSRSQTPSLHGKSSLLWASSIWWRTTRVDGTTWRGKRTVLLSAFVLISVTRLDTLLCCPCAYSQWTTLRWSASKSTSARFGNMEFTNFCRCIFCSVCAQKTGGHGLVCFPAIKELCLKIYTSTEQRYCFVHALSTLVDIFVLER